MMNKKTSYKRIVSLVLAVFMVASLLSVSAVADNKIIKINGELAVNDGTYESGALVTIDTDDTVTVTVNGKNVDLGANKAFTLTTETTDTPDAAATDDQATPDTPDVPVEEGTVVITVYNANGEVVAEVTVTIKPVDNASDSTTDEATDDQATDDQATDDQATDDQATDDQATDDQATDDQATDDEATDDQGKDSDDQPKDSDDQPKDSDDQPKDSDDVPEDTGDVPQKVKVLNGDVDGDGVITSNDALLILRYSIGLEEFNKIQLAQGDLDNDGVYATDALTVLRASLKLDTITPEYIEVEV